MIEHSGAEGGGAARGPQPQKRRGQDGEAWQIAWLILSELQSAARDYGVSFDAEEVGFIKQALADAAQEAMNRASKVAARGPQVETQRLIEQHARHAILEVQNQNASYRPTPDEENLLTNMRLILTGFAQALSPSESKDSDKGIVGRMRRFAADFDAWLGDDRRGYDGLIDISAGLRYDLRAALRGGAPAPQSPEDTRIAKLRGDLVRLHAYSSTDAADQDQRVVLVCDLEEVLAADSAREADGGAPASPLKIAPLITVVEKALDDMDRAGGDGYGMPECPWCHRQGEERGDDGLHAGGCELESARSALASMRAVLSGGVPAPQEHSDE